MAGALFPNTPGSGKGSKVFISSSDGALLSAVAMTKQAIFEYKGKFYTNLVYLLGEGKTLINIRAEMQPVIGIDGILQGLEISAGAADKAAVSAGVDEVAGVQGAVAANAAVALTRPAADKICWNAIIVTKSSGVITAVKGTDAADALPASLLLTYGTAAGQKPLIPVDSLLIGCVKLIDDGAAVITDSDIDYTDREDGGVDFQILPNIGGLKLQTALPEIHTGAIPREIKFTGRYLNAALAEVPTAKNWDMSGSASSQSEETFGNAYSASSPGATSFAFEQLASDRKVFDAKTKREGFAAIRLQLPNGFYWEGVGNVSPSIKVGATAFTAISVSGTFADEPATSS